MRQIHANGRARGPDRRQAAPGPDSAARVGRHRLEPLLAPGNPAVRPRATAERGTTFVPRVWVLTEGRAGDDAQIRTLAAALGWPWEVIEARDGLSRVVIDRLRDACGLEGEPRLPEERRGSWPDMVIAAGGRSVSLARRIRRASGGRTRLVFVGRPWAALDQFDLIITTPQYRLPARPNILHNRLPMNRPEPERLAAAARVWRSALRHLPRPWLAILVGGDSGSFRMTRASADRLAVRANAWADACGGSLLVATSGRTPSAAARQLLEGIRDPAWRYRWRAHDPDNPYLGFLALADAFLVTGDSASMLAEALDTGRPVELFPLEQRLFSKLLTSRVLAGAASDAGGSRPARLWARCRDKLTERGYWLPARDLHYMHDVLRARGLLADGGEVRLARSAPRADDLERAVARVRALLPTAARAEQLHQDGRVELVG